MHGWYRLSFLTALLTSVSFSQYLDSRLLITPPKREFRGAWIATVNNIDWPTTKGTNVRGQQETELRAILDALQATGINAVFFQVRPACDAMYKSEIEPWSEWLTGTQGAAPTDSNYDPLEVIIAACRERGMEIHAWFNPYRAVPDTSRPVANNHVSKLHPEWLLAYGSLRILDPGKHEVREYVTRVIMDVVRRYDIDGVHFDDYFYPYSGTTNQDAATFSSPLYNRGFTNIADWRRDNVNLLVKMVNDSIQMVKPRVKFGISPFGIWRNRSSDLNGSMTNGAQSFDDIYADSRKWLQEGWVDYLVPQLYWKFDHPLAPYRNLNSWWNDQNSLGRHLFIGHLTASAATSSSWSIQELINQIEDNRTYLKIHGSAHFSAKYFRDNNRLLRDSLLRTVYSAPALIPIMNWGGKDIIPPNRPDNVKVLTFGSSLLMTWQEPQQAPDGDRPVQYVVYRSTSFPVDISDMRNAVQLTRSTSYLLDRPTTGNYVYTVTSLDRNHNESERSSTVIVSSSGNVVVGVQEPVTVPLAFELQQNYPNPFNSSTVIQFTMPYETQAVLKVYDLLGREVAVLVDRVLGAGVHQASFDAQSLPSGLYIYRLVAGGQVVAKKMQLVK